MKPIAISPVIQMEYTDRSFLHMHVTVTTCILTNKQRTHTHTDILNAFVETEEVPVLTHLRQ